MIDKLFDKDNFLGTGKSLEQWMLERQVERWTSTYQNQSVEERRRRWHYVTLLMDEHIRLARKYNPDGGLAGFPSSVLHTQIIIEAVWDGDWTKVKEALSYSTLDVMREVGIENPEQWAEELKTFRAVAQEAFDSRPEGPSDGERH